MLHYFRRVVRRRHSVSIPAIIFSTFILLLIMALLLEPPQNHLFARARLKFFGNEISCYRVHNVPTLPDISDEPELPDPGKSIFFHETSCNSLNNGRIIISGRQACAVESAALVHPDKKVFLLFTSPGVIKSGIGDEIDLVLTELESYNNIFIKHLNFEKYINNTCLENLYTGGSIELSRYSRSHASDVLRYLTLWKYGGIYLDLDVVVTKSLNSLGQNFAGSESPDNVAAGVLAFSHDKLGHMWAQNCLDDLSESFSGSDWGYNGPGVITRLLRKICRVQKAKDMKNCEGFRVLSSKEFYPVPWRNWDEYFDPKKTNSTLKLVENSYTIHVWNKISHNTEVAKNSAYAIIAKNFCPKVYRILEDSKI